MQAKRFIFIVLCAVGGGLKDLAQSRMSVNYLLEFIQSCLAIH